MGARRVVLLRAVNVGSAQLPMALLREMATELGAADVTTHIASGNLLCTPPGDAAGFDRALEAAVEQRFGFFREAISRTAAELGAALSAHPFEVEQASWSHVVFLLAAPEPDRAAAAAQVDTGGEQWQLIGREAHVRYHQGAGQAHPGVGRALARLGTPGTARNLHTVRRLIELAGG